MNPRPPSRFGAALVAERKKRNISQYRLAQLLRRSPRYVSNIEQDKYEPRFTSILLFASALDMDPGDLVRAAAELSWAESDSQGEANTKQADDARLCRENSEDGETERGSSE